MVKIDKKILKQHQFKNYNESKKVQQLQNVCLTSDNISNKTEISTKQNRDTDSETHFSDTFLMEYQLLPFFLNNFFNFFC